MKLEFIPAAQLIRLFDFDTEQASRLQAIFADLATITIRSVELHEAGFVTAIDDCHLTLAVARRDLDIVKTGEPATFQCALTPETWENIHDLTEPFTHTDSAGFQWLIASPIRLLISNDGHW